MYERRLSGLQRSRMQRMLEMVAERVQDERARGHEPRADGFFFGKPHTRSFSEEVAEGGFRTVQEEHEEAKLPYFAELLVNCVFNREIDRTSAVSFVALASALTYRQLCLLALMERQQEFTTLRSDERFRFMDGDSECPIWQATLAQEVFDLGNRRLVNIHEESIGKLGVLPIVTLTRLGQEVHSALGLSLIERNVLDDLYHRSDPESGQTTRSNNGPGENDPD